MAKSDDIGYFYRLGLTTNETCTYELHVSLFALTFRLLSRLHRYYTAS